MNSIGARPEGRQVSVTGVICKEYWM